MLEACLDVTPYERRGLLKNRQTTKNGGGANLHRGNVTQVSENTILIFINVITFSAVFYVLGVVVGVVAHSERHILPHNQEPRHLKHVS